MLGQGHELGRASAPPPADALTSAVLSKLDALTSAQAAAEGRLRGTEAVVDGLRHATEQLHALLSKHFGELTTCPESSPVVAPLPAPFSGMRTDRVLSKESLRSGPRRWSAFCPTTVEAAASGTRDAGMPRADIGVSVVSAADVGDVGSTKASHVEGASSLFGMSKSMGSHAMVVPEANPLLTQAREDFLTQEEVGALTDKVVADTGSSSMIIDGFDAGRNRSRFMLEPYSKGRVVFDVVSLFILLYDAISTPIALAWDIPMEGTLKTVLACCTCFWALDIVLSFNTGIFNNGDLEMRRRVVAMRYLRTWLIPDLVIVLSDATTIFSLLGGEGGNSYGGILRMSKMSRFVRLIRLCRVARSFDQVERSLQQYFGGGWHMAVEILKPFMSIMMINHFLACCWYAIGRWMPSDTGLRWIDTQLGNDSTLEYKDAGILYQYTTCLHWSMTQLTPGSMQVFPLNTFERCFNFLCLVLGMLIFGVLISSLSAKMTQYRAGQREKFNKLATLRRFLHDKGVQGALAVSVVQQVRQRMSKASVTPLVPKDVQALTLLSSSLRRALQCELCKPQLRHPLFRWWGEFDPGAFEHFCTDATEFFALAPGDHLFISRSEAGGAHFIIKGALQYELTSGPDRHGGTRQVVDFASGVICEAALWCKWKYMGNLTAETGCEALVVKSAGLKASLESFGAIRHVAVVYGSAFYERVTSALGHSVDEVQDASGQGISDLYVPFAAFDAILPSLPITTRLLLAAVALRTCPMWSIWGPASLNKRHPMDMLQEVQEGKCSIMISATGQLERVVSIVALRLERSNGKVLAEVGSLVDDSIKVDCKLPGSKPREGQLPSAVMQKILHGSELAPLAEAIQFTQTSEETVCGVSERMAVTTKYTRTVYNAALSVPVEELDLEETCVGGPSTLGGRHSSLICNMTSSDGMFGNTLNNVHRPRASFRGEAAHGSNHVANHLDFDVFALADQSGRIHLYAWLNSVELEHFRTAAGKLALAELLKGVHVTDEVSNIASKRLSLVKASADEGMVLNVVAGEDGVTTHL